MERYEKLKLENQLCFSLYAASRELIKLYKPLLDKYNLTYTQYIVMLVLWEGKKLNVKHIGERLHLDSGTLTPLLKKLQGLDLIKKYRDSQDDRVVIIELTEKGLALKKEIVEVPEQLYCNFSEDAEKLLVLKKSLDDFLAILS
ncbi:MarR family transcriptional regulator [Clostridium sp. CX1]|uniref:MarR family winged helix-turn-helix transcriptional regulator n=1 Tax=Clostridium sp. CX1 TaxID=2978346 RepID=UPI0021BEEDDC|nr:MarR family transcriptional regulator [Clostridium sp. CX1]MCT8977012.1 MarR family transcriptional regulator [Clostridium sp. CX1]